MNRLLFFIAAWFWVVSAAYAQNVAPNVEAIRQDLIMLTSDEHGGRGTGDTGFLAAANYVANQLLELGFHSFNSQNQPAEKAEDFFHQVPLIKEKLISVELQTGKKNWKYGKDFYTNRAFGSDAIYSDSLSFVAYDQLGQLLPAQLQNQVVVIWRQKVEKAKRSPSIREIARSLNRFSPQAILVIDAEFPSQPTLITNALAAENICIDYSRDREYGVSPTAGRTIPIIIVSEKVGRKMFKSAGLDWKKSWAGTGQTSSQPIVRQAFKLKAKATVISEPFEAPNVAGLLPGKKNSEEYIVLSAHLDHLGIHDGKIYYGADDNGSGSAALLEMSRLLFAYRDQGNLPDKTIVFLWLTGEEHGLLGSQYFTSFPPVPLESIKVNLNVDMIGRVDKAHLNEPNYVYLIGSDRLSSDLHRISEEVNASCCGINFDYTYNDPNDPNRYYQRSDHYNFAKYGIPVIFYFSGVHEDYHKPSDTPDKIDYNRIARIANLIFLTAYELANREEALLIDKQ